ncbi:hypothetical protein FAGKG844_30238 [Frankia sp. AgKG'84/4]
MPFVGQAPLSSGSADADAALTPDAEDDEPDFPLQLVTSTRARIVTITAAQYRALRTPLPLPHSHRSSLANAYGYPLHRNRSRGRFHWHAAVARPEPRRRGAYRRPLGRDRQQNDSRPDEPASGPNVETGAAAGSPAGRHLRADSSDVEAVGQTLKRNSTTSPSAMT